MDSAAFRTACAGLGIELSERQVAAFDAFERALYAANEQRNLTRVPQESCWLRHFVDSLLLSEFVPHGSEVLDIGSGPGFPAWPLACARPDLKVTALDSNGKMLGFLQSQPLPNIAVVQARAEDNPRREAFNVVTGRALAPISVQLELSAAPCRIGGFVMPMRTPNDEPFGEAAKLGLSLERVHHRPLPGTDVVRVFPEYRKTTATSRRFPRPWAEMRSK